MTTRAQPRYPVCEAVCCVLLLWSSALGEEAPPSKQPPPGKEAPLGEEAPESEQAPLFEQEPYDQITLDENNDNAVLQVVPLSLPGRRVPDPFPSRGTLQVRLLEDRESVYEVNWHTIAQIELFEDLVLNKANELVRSGRFDEAYDYFEYLLDKDPKRPGLEIALQDYLYAEAETFLKQGEYDDSLALLRELHARNPEREGLEDALGRATDPLIQKYLKADDYGSARQLVRDLAELFPQHAVVKRWEGQFKQQVADLLVEGRKAAQSGQLREAHRVGRRAIHIWPSSPEAKQFIDSIQKQYPRVVVGVTAPATVLEPGRMHDWASRRSSRLVYRTLMELIGRGAEGGKYFCPLGDMTVEELGYRLAFHLAPDWASGRALTGYDLGRQLLAMADPTDAAYRFDWADLLDRISVDPVYTQSGQLHHTVNAELRRPHVRPEALLRCVVVRHSEPGGSGESSVGNGPYTVDSRSPEEVVYLINPAYSAAEPGQPKELVERYYVKGARAIQALARRQIDVLDRVNPWDLDEVRSMSDVVVQRYAVPTLHCLIPNVHKPFTERYYFRQALIYGIHREGILKHLLRSDELPPGCQVISGPLSPGISHDDPLDYAYDHSIEPREYEPQMAVALAQATFVEVAAAMEKKEGVRLEAMPEFVLAHPPHEIARMACQSIKRQLALLGIPITLRELSAGMPERIPEDVDLLYVELAMWEPVVDARRLLDEEGIAGGSSPHMSLALRQLDEAQVWAKATERLQYIHWLAHQEVSVVPLWQLTDHYAYRRGLKGMGTDLASLYQNVETWEPPTQYVAEGE